MKNLLIKLFTVAGFVAVLSGCYYDEIAEFSGLPTNVSFKNDVAPIFTKSCATVGCHDAVPAHQPSLVAEKAYQQLINGGFVNTTEPDKSHIYTIINSNNMPPSGPLGKNDKLMILGWISEGAQNN